MSDQTRDPVCAACQNALEMGTLEEHVSLVQHLAGCTQCQAVNQEIEHIERLASQVPLPEADTQTVQRTWEAVTAILDAQRQTERRARRHVLLRLLLVGFVVVPLIIAFNAALGYLVYWALGGLSTALTWALVGGLALLCGLVLSLYWGALPILTQVALNLRRGAADGQARPTPLLSSSPMSGLMLQLI